MNPARADVESYIRQVALQYRLDPDQAIRQCEAESNFEQSALASNGAEGLFQLMPQTARSLAVDPADWKQNVTGALHFLRLLGLQFQTQPQVLAAYDWGPGNVSHAITEYGDNWQAHLPKETSDYIARIYVATEAAA